MAGMFYSLDEVMEKLSKNKRIRIFKHAKNKGKANALKTGYSKAKTNILATIDADRTYPPEAIPRLVKKFKKGKYDMIVGSRFKKGMPKNAGLIRSTANMTGSFIASIMLGKKITDLTTGLRVMNRKTAEMKVKAKNLEYEAEITSRVISNGLKYGEVMISVEKREGHSKLNFLKNCYLFIKHIIIGKYLWKK